MKSIRLKILAMLAIVAGGAIMSAIISLYGLHRADDLNTRSEIQGNVALLTQRINGLVTAVVMDSRGIYMAKNSQEAEPFAKGVEDRFPALRTFVADLQKIAPTEQRDTVDRIAKAVEDFITFRGETVRLGRSVSPAAASAVGYHSTGMRPARRSSPAAARTFAVAGARSNTATAFASPSAT